MDFSNGYENSVALPTPNIGEIGSIHNDATFSCLLVVPSLNTVLSL